MATFNLKTGKVSSTKDISSTKVSDTNLSSTNLSSTKDIEETANISSTKVSSTKYMNEYKREKYDTLRLDFPKGTKADWKREADARGISVTKMVKIAVEQYLGGAL